MATTIRLSDRIHSLLKKMAQEQGKTMQELFDEIVEKYRREEILRQHNLAYEQLSKQEWQEEVQERQEWEGTILDDMEERND